jgi:hypothetical protein
MSVTIRIRIIRATKIPRILGTKVISGKEETSSKVTGITREVDRTR